MAARRYFAEGLNVARECGRRDATALALYQLARLEDDMSNYRNSRTYASEALDLFRRLGMKHEQAEAEALLAKLESSQQD